MGVTKTDFMHGLQCRKMLWLDSHRPELGSLPEAVQKKLDEGNAFGDEAMGAFGAYEETTSFLPDGRLDFSAMLSRTQELLSSGAPVICEAAFSWRGHYCAADILKRNGSVYDVYEVKNAPAVCKEFVLDLGFQVFLMSKCGFFPAGCFLLLNGAKDEKDGGRVETKYKTVDVTAAVRRAAKVAEKHLFAFAAIKGKSAPCPSVPAGEQCDSAYLCRYFGYCRGENR